MILPDGREHLATLPLPLPLEVVPLLMEAIGEAAERYGYTDVRFDFDGARIVGTPPDRSTPPEVPQTE